MSVEFIWLLGAQAGRHQRALRCYISTHRGKKKHVPGRWLITQKRTSRNTTTKNKTKSKVGVQYKTRSKQITTNVSSSCSTALLIACVGDWLIKQRLCPFPLYTTCSIITSLKHRMPLQDWTDLQPIGKGFFPPHTVYTHIL